jgi:hypothetical protein
MCGGEEGRMTGKYGKGSARPWGGRGKGGENGGMGCMCVERRGSGWKDDRRQRNTVLKMGRVFLILGIVFLFQFTICLQWECNYSSFKKIEHTGREEQLKKLRGKKKKWGKKKKTEWGVNTAIVRECMCVCKFECWVWVRECMWMSVWVCVLCEMFFFWIFEKKIFFWKREKNPKSDCCICHEF